MWVIMFNSLWTTLMNKLSITVFFVKSFFSTKTTLNNNFASEQSNFSSERNFKYQWQTYVLNFFGYESTKLSLSLEPAVNIFALLTRHAIVMKGRTMHYINKWVYSTNHKRIAVNYFWFVIFSGICGMVLATIIRLEMAYPGVGILAGDSLQYLSVVTAHAVIMVFFMIMPLLFGAFGNFLLPTQLGVHDVAFPRLNSAAFWFLPAGLLMLVQLVCLDRRYQRMNCFNIREIQSLLRARFFSDLVNSNEHNLFLNKTVIGLRYKTNNLDSINPNMLLFHHYGIQSDKTSKYYNFIFETNETHAGYKFLNSNSIIYNLLASDSLSTNSPISITAKTVWNGVYQFIFRVLNLANPSYPQNLDGDGTWYAFNETLFNQLKSEAKREWHILLSGLDFNEPLWVTSTVYVGAKHRLLDDLQFGLFHNNMSFHKERLARYGEFPHPKIITDQNLIILYITGAYHLSSKSWLVFVRKWCAVHYDFAIRTFNRLHAAYLFLISPEGFCKLEFLNFTSAYQPLSVILLAFDSFILSSTYFATYVYTTILYTALNPVASVTGLFSVASFSLFGVGFTQVSHSTAVMYLYNSFSRLNVMVEAKARELPTITVSNSHDLSSTLPDQASFAGQEVSTNYRHQRFTNPVFKYHFKLGNYLPRDLTYMFPHLFNTMSDVTTGIRKSSWFFSPVAVDLIKDNFNNYISFFSTNQAPFVNDNNRRLTLPHTFGFYNFFYTLSSAQDFIDSRWGALGTLNKKFYKIFSTSTMQQRIYANWRQLKFTREAWRCKLLASRHQKTLFHRYVNEENVLWAVERNAKDLLPGWAMITPFSARTRFTAIGKVDLGLMGVFLVLNSSIVSSANFLVTYRYLSTLNNRKMRDARAFFAEGVMVASWMMIAANPMLAIGILMLLSDRHWQTSFFDYSGGGDTVLFQHMFWFFGHPEVYVIMIPVFGFTNTILSFYLRKRVSARASLMYSMYTIAFLGFFVWGHHMYMVGLAHTTRMLFSTLTVMISVPAATKLMHWCVTIVNSSFAVELPLVFTLLFIFFFVSGGISGMAVAHTGMDILFHDSFYVIGHFHVMFAGSAMFGSFAAFYFYFPAIFGVKFSRIWGYLHCTYYLIGQLMTVVPMFWLGYAGMPRRVLDYPAALGGWHGIISAGHLLSVAGMMAFFIMIFDSLRQAKAATRNSFGITRFNTRLNFYLYETARTQFLKKKGWYISRFDRPNSLTLNKLNFNNNEYLETTLYSYSFFKN